MRRLGVGVIGAVLAVDVLALVAALVASLLG
jgi:hypothetical protein